MAKQTLNVIVNGNQYTVEVQDVNASPLTMVVNGKTYTVELSGVQPPVRHPQAAVQAPVPAQPVTQETPATVPKPTPTVFSTPANGGGQVTSPMPGVILDIQVKAGDAVKKGDQLCSLEAMKMKSAIRSPKDGTVSSVEVKEGQKVNHNDILFRFS
ncbi:MAG: biotin/lipoyl-binding protein [Anaerolineaceae bacterium]|nr:biotin/lipoyl-binding protein [Anaerolineaceae bacterium]